MYGKLQNYRRLPQDPFCSFEFFIGITKMLRLCFLIAFVSLGLTSGCSRSPDTATDTKILGTWKRTYDDGSGNTCYSTRTFSPQSQYKLQYRRLSSTIEQVGTWKLSGSALTINYDVTKFVVNGEDVLPTQTYEETHSESTETVVSVSELIMITAIGKNQNAQTWTR